MAIFTLHGLKIDSELYGNIGFVYAKYSQLDTLPSGNFINVMQLTEQYPFIPWEQTLILSRPNMADNENYQFEKYFDWFGFPLRAPFTMLDVTDTLHDDGTYWDKWTLSNGNTYYVMSRGSGNAKWIVLNTTPELNSNMVRFTLTANQNTYPVVSMASYCPELDPTKLYYTSFKFAHNGMNFSVGYTSQSGTTFPFSQTATEAEINFYTNLPEDLPVSGDPYGGDPSGTGGGGGGHDNSSDTIDFPSLPSLSAVDAGFITLFNPSTSQLKNLASYMWSGLFDVATFQKLFADPMQAILGLSIVPVNVPAGGAEEVKVGNISTGVSMQTAASQYVELDCGSIDVNEYWSAYLDYNPYTKTTLYLPYIGMRDVSSDDIMNKTVHIKYHVDILSGACVAYVKCGDSILYQYAGSCAVSVPISGNDWTQAINGVMNIAAALGTTVATGGAAAPMAATMIASTAVNGLKQDVGRSGASGGAAGLLGIQKPFLIITRPRQAIPEHQNAYQGYPAFITASLGSLSGFTRVDTVHLSGIPATDDELDEIENLLKEGVIL